MEEDLVQVDMIGKKVQEEGGGRAEGRKKGEGGRKKGEGGRKKRKKKKKNSNKGIFRDIFVTHLLCVWNFISTSNLYPHNKLRK